MSSQHIQTTYVCRLEALTPVHVGSGETLKKDFDFFVQNGKVHLVSSARIMAEVAKLGLEKIDAFATAMDDQQTGQWLKQQGIRVEKLAQSSYALPGGKKDPSEIRAQIKDGFGVPYLPGSSIKGALRTAIIRKLAASNRTKVEPGSSNLKFADQKVCKPLLGKDAKLNLMRCLAVGDFAIKDNATALYMVWVNRLTSTTNFAGKFPLCIEGSSNKAIATGSISINHFLSAMDQEWQCFNFKAQLNLPWLIEACRELAEHTIKTELAFFRGKTGKPVQGIVVFYEGLQEKQKQLKENEIIFQMAWGAGWRGMTGQLLEEADLSPRVREKLKLAPKYKESFPFPKSRRIVTVDGKDMPLGWVKLSFLSKEELRKREETERQEVIIREREQKKEREQKAIANAAQALEAFRQQVASCKNLPGEIDGFIQQAQQNKSPEDRRLMCQALIDKANSLSKKKKFMKALKEGKNWAVKLKKLCEENGMVF